MSSYKCNYHFPLILQSCYWSGNWNACFIFVSSSCIYLVLFFSLNLTPLSAQSPGRKTESGERESVPAKPISKSSLHPWIITASSEEEMTELAHKWKPYPRDNLIVTTFHSSNHLCCISNASGISSHNWRLISQKCQRTTQNGTCVMCVLKQHFA